MTPKTEVIHALTRSELFSCCDPDEVSCRLQSFDKGCGIPVDISGDPCVGVVVAGRVQVYSMCADGTAINISTLFAGDSFGISNIFSGDDLSTVLTCDRNTSVAYIPQDCFFNLLEKYPRMMWQYAVLCNRKIRYLTQKIEFLTIPTCRARLVSFLLHNQQNGCVSLEYSKEQLARVLGVSRASLFRELSELSRDGLVLVKGRDIKLLDSVKLEELMQNASQRPTPA